MHDLLLMPSDKNAHEALAFVQLGEHKHLYPNVTPSINFCYFLVPGGVVLQVTGAFRYIERLKGWLV